jgi:uncharacterized membrane protein
MFWNGYCGPAGGNWLIHGPFFMMLMFFAAIFFFYIISGSRKKESVAGLTDTAIEILRNRYAAGEIDENEYMARKDKLGQ